MAYTNQLMQMRKYKMEYPKTPWKIPRNLPMLTELQINSIEDLQNQWGRKASWEHILLYPTQTTHKPRNIFTFEIEPILRTMQKIYIKTTLRLVCSPARVWGKNQSGCMKCNIHTSYGSEHTHVYMYISTCQNLLSQSLSSTSQNLLYTI